MDKENMVCIQNKILVSHKRELNSVLVTKCMELEIIIKLNYPGPERQVSHYFTHTWKIKS
jgi:hypothetical protein